MNPEALEKIRIVELTKDDPSLPKLNSRYSTSSYYDLSIAHEPEAWKVQLILKPLEKPLEKSYTGTFFETHVEEPRAFAAVLDETTWGGSNLVMSDGIIECVSGNSS